MTEQSNNPYEDILGLPHHVSETRPQMPRADRAVQFAPFAALTGYDAEILETARRTEKRVELDEHEKSVLDGKLHYMNAHPDALYSVTFFQPDAKKAGGRYVTEAGTVAKIDPYQGILLLSEGRRIPIKEIIRIEGDPL